MPAPKHLTMSSFFFLDLTHTLWCCWRVCLNMQLAKVSHLLHNVSGMKKLFCMTHSVCVPFYKGQMPTPAPVIYCLYMRPNICLFT